MNSRLPLRTTTPLIFFPLILTVLLPTACSSLDPEPAGSFDAAALAGMIYDSGSRPLRGAVVTVDGNLETVSDLNGRFLTPPITPGEHRLEVRKAGYETKRVRIEFSSRLEVLYLSLVSFGELLTDAERSLDANDLAGAESYLARAALIQEEDPALLMLTVVLFSEAGERASARGAAERLLLLGFDSDNFPQLRDFLE